MTIIDFSTRLPTKSDTRTDLQRSAKQQHTNQGFKKTTPIPTNVTKPQQLAEGSYALTSPRPEPPLQEWSTSNSGVPYNANSEGITLREENMRPVDTTDTKASQTCSKPDLIETTDGEFLAPFEPGHGHGILGNSRKGDHAVLDILAEKGQKVVDMIGDTFHNIRKKVDGETSKMRVENESSI